MPSPDAPLALSHGSGTATTPPVGSTLKPTHPKRAKASGSNSNKQRLTWALSPTEPNCASGLITMDQDAFRNLLASSRRSQSNATQAALTTTNSVRQKAPTCAPSEPAFKPRKVKKAEGKYRDRAAERREGTGNDYAQIEAVLEDFEKRVAHEDKDIIEQQREYLGGDSQHTILVKGLDMSLLEQNRARAATTTEDDEVLEQAYADATSTSKPTEPRKRTRETIVRDLKAKRQNEDWTADQLAIEQSLSIEEDGLGLEAAKKVGKFKPIGFKPIGQTETRSKKRKAKEGKEGVKKKNKVENVLPQSGVKAEPTKETPAVHQAHNASEPCSSKTSQKPPEPELTPQHEDFDIFAGAGEYDGFPVDEESEEEHRDTEEVEVASGATEAVSSVPVISTRSWFGEPESQDGHTFVLPEKLPPIPGTTRVEEGPEEMRLKPLESSALPSIRDFLAVDEAVERAEKRKAHKEKKKKKKKTGDDDDD